MTNPIAVNGSFADGRINAEVPFERVTELVMDGHIVVVKGVFAAESERLRALRRAIFEWGLATEPLEQPEPTENCHCLQVGVSKFQKTPHLYHSYNFNRLSQLDPALSAQLSTYFEPLRVFQNAITGNAARFESFGEGGPVLHPQVIQYPIGGGMFGRHFHPLEPQRIGLIVALSQRGVEYGRGGTGFDVGGQAVELELAHDMGDIALFRFDIPHWVTPSNLNDKFDWNSERGRWTMVLPYY